MSPSLQMAALVCHWEHIFLLMPDFMPAGLIRFADEVCLGAQAEARGAAHCKGDGGAGAGGGPQAAGAGEH